MKTAYKIRVTYSDSSNVEYQPTTYRLDNGWLTMIWDRDDTAEHLHIPAAKVDLVHIDIEHLDDDHDD